MSGATGSGSSTPTRRREVPPASCWKSGGRDRWSPAREREPDDVRAAVWELLGEVTDPELPVSIADLGLVYSLEVEGRKVRLALTFTATACPCMEFIREDIRDRLLQEWWLEEVVIEEVWHPPWTTDRITPAGRSQLRRFGVGA